MMCGRARHTSVRVVLSALTLMVSAALTALAQAEPVRLSVLMHAVAAGDGDAALRAALERAQSGSPHFIVVNGVKDAAESCNDALFRRRKALLDGADVPVFLSMAGSDWMDCRDRRGRPAESVWLSLLREQLYGDGALKAARLSKLRRQSALPAFRNYAENTRWSLQDVMFATLHLPAPNNHYVSAAGRNSEFEDRLIANHDWLKRLAQHAAAERHRAIVLFCDGSLWPLIRQPSGSRDGFREMRSALQAFAAKVRMPVLVVQGGGDDRPEPPVIERQGSLAYLSLPHGIADLEIDADATVPFILAGTEHGAHWGQ